MSTISPIFRISGGCWSWYAFDKKIDNQTLMLFWGGFRNSNTLTHTHHSFIVLSQQMTMQWRDGWAMRSRIVMHITRIRVCASRGKTDIACRRATICWHDKWLFTYPFAFHSVRHVQWMTLSSAGSSEDILPIVWFESSLFRLELSALIYLSLRAAEFIYCCWKSQVVNDYKKNVPREFMSVCFRCGTMSLACFPFIQYYYCRVCESRLFAVCLRSKKQQMRTARTFLRIEKKKNILTMILLL